MYANSKMDNTQCSCYVCVNTSQGFTIGLKVYNTLNSWLKTDNQPKLSFLELWCSAVWIKKRSSLCEVILCCLCSSSLINYPFLYSLDRKMDSVPWICRREYKCSSETQIVIGLRHKTGWKSKPFPPKCLLMILNCMFLEWNFFVMKKGMKCFYMS